MEKNIQKPSLKKQATFLLLGRLIALGIGFFSTILLVRILPVAQYGLYQQILFVLAMLSVLTSLRIPQSLYYFFPRVEDKHDNLISQSLSVLAVISLSCAVIFYILCRYFGILPTEITEDYFLPICIYVMIGGCALLLDHIFILEKKSKFVPILTTCNAVVRVIFVVGTVLLFRSILAVIYALVFFVALRLLFLLAYLLKRYSIRFGISDVKLLVKQIRYCLPLSGSAIIGMIGTYFEKVVLMILMSATDFAVYSVGGLRIVNPATLLYTSVGNVSVIRFGELAIQKDFEGIKLLWAKMVTINAMLTIPLVFFCFVFSEQIIILLYTDKYIESTIIFRINLFVLLAQMLGYGYIPLAMGRTKAIMLGNALRATFTVAGSFFLIKYLGIIGGAIVFVVGFWINAMVQLHAAKKAIKMSLREIFPWKKLCIISLLSGVAVWLSQNVMRFDLSSFNSLLIAALIYFSIMLIGLKFLGYLDIGSIRKYVNEMIR